MLFDHNHNKLTIRGLDVEPDVLAFKGHEYLSQPFRYDIQFTSTNHGITPETVLMQDASFSLCAPPEQGMAVMTPQRTLHGVITAFKCLSASRDETHYEVRLEPRLALLSRSHQSAIFQDMSVSQITEKILRERHGLRGQDFVFKLNNEYPRREQVMQYGENDLTFLSRLLAETGIWFRFAADSRLKIEVIEFYDDQQGYEQGITLPLRHPSGMYDGTVEAAWALNSSHSVVENTVTTRDYNYRDAQRDMDSAMDVTAGDKTTRGEAYHYADNFREAGSPQTIESGGFYARIRHERYLNGQTRLGGTSNSVTLMPGQALKVTGGEAPDMFAHGVVITAIHTRAARDRSYTLEFEAIPCSERYCFRAPSPEKPVMAGTLPARVTSTQPGDLYGHIDKDGRYRVNLLFDRDTWPAGYESLWVRQARQYAGDTYGFHLPLLAGTEVAIAFENGDPDRPYIAHALHDSAHPDHVTIRNNKRNVLRTPTNNKFRLDDTRGQEHIKLSTEYGGKSQINLGHIVDSGKQKRGEGFELRTDKWGTIRGGQGLFISADMQAKAQDLQLEMKAALETLQQAQGLAQSLSEAVKTANAELAQVAAQKSLMEGSLKDLQQAALLLSAPAGIAQVSPESIQISTGNNFIQTSAENSDFSVFKKFTVAAGEVISLFAKTLGIKIFANKGKVEIQAQDDNMELTAMKDMKIQSKDGEVYISTAKKITLACDKTALIIERSGVTIKTLGDVNVKSATFNRQIPQPYNYTPPELPPGATCKERT